MNFAKEYTKFISLIEQARNELERDIVMNKGNIELKKEYVQKYNVLLQRNCDLLWKLTEDLTDN